MQYLSKQVKKSRPKTKFTVDKIDTFSVYVYILPYT